MSVDKPTIDVKMGSEKGFGLVFAVVFTIIALYPLWHGNPVRVWPLPFAAVCLGLAYIRPSWLATPNRLWFRFGMILGAIVSPIVMGLVFFLVFAPMGFALRLFRKNPMAPHADEALETYWIRRDTALQSFQRQF